jgi:hypothetical protein
MLAKREPGVADKVPARLMAQDSQKCQCKALQELFGPDQHDFMNAYYQQSVVPCLVSQSFDSKRCDDSTKEKKSIRP